MGGVAVAVYRILPTEDSLGELVSFGPLTTGTQRMLQIPGRFARTVLYQDLPLKLELNFVFDGDKVQIRRLEAEATSEHVTSRDLTQLALPSITRDAALSAVRNADYWIEVQKNVQSDSGLDLMFLAQLYWFEHVTWGSPRLAIQNFLGCKRTTANYYIRMIGSKFALPGVHKEKDIK
jgi:hypothetical protein